MWASRTGTPLPKAHATHAQEQMQHEFTLGPTVGKRGRLSQRGRKREATTGLSPTDRWPNMALGPSLLLRTCQPRSGRLPSDPVPTGAPEHAVSVMPANATQRVAADGSSGENAPPALLGLCSARGPLRGVTTGTAEAVKTRRYLTYSPYTPRHWYWRACKVRSVINKHGLHRPTMGGSCKNSPSAAPLVWAPRMVRRRLRASC